MLQGRNAWYLACILSDKRHNAMASSSPSFFPEYLCISLAGYTKRTRDASHYNFMLCTEEDFGPARSIVIEDPTRDEGCPVERCCNRTLISEGGISSMAASQRFLASGLVSPSCANSILQLETTKIDRTSFLRSIFIRLEK